MLVQSVSDEQPSPLPSVRENVFCDKLSLVPKEHSVSVCDFNYIRSILWRRTYTRMPQSVISSQSSMIIIIIMIIIMIFMSIMIIDKWKVMAEQGEETSLLSGCRALMRAITKVVTLIIIMMMIVMMMILMMIVMIGCCSVQ